MGAILSCLGISERDPNGEDPETSRLLSEDHFQSRYGAAPYPQRRTVQQPDPEAVRREREAMGRIVDAMSDEVVDVFSRVPPSATQARHQSSRMLPRINGSRERKRTSDEIAIRTLKKGKAHRIASILDVDALRHTTGKE